MTSSDPYGLCRDEGCPQFGRAHVCINRNEPDFELECIRCEEVVHSDTMDEDGRCGDCQERAHQATEMYR